MAISLKVPAGMTLAQSLHALLLDTNWTKQPYSKEQRNIHQILNDRSNLKEAANYINAFIEGKKASGSNVIDDMWGKKIGISFSSFPSLDVRRYEGHYGEYSAGKALRNYNQLNPIHKIQAPIPKQSIEKAAPKKEAVAETPGLNGRGMGMLLLAIITGVAVATFALIPQDSNSN